MGRHDRSRAIETVVDREPLDLHRIMSLERIRGDLENNSMLSHTSHSVTIHLVRRSRSVDPNFNEPMTLTVISVLSHSPAAYVCEFIEGSSNVLNNVHMTSPYHTQIMLAVSVKLRRLYMDTTSSIFQKSAICLAYQFSQRILKVSEHPQVHPCAAITHFMSTTFLLDL